MEEVTAAIIKTLKKEKRHLHTITYDNGKEFAGHAAIAKKLGVKCYFAKPYRSWERGLNEHTNGLVRQYFPKKTLFGYNHQRGCATRSKHSQQQTKTNFKLSNTTRGVHCRNSKSCTWGLKGRNKRLLLRFEHKSEHHFAMKLMAYTMINLCHFCN